ncbi:hypothetical protein ONZ45_g108 [Pleurotus djamor]|nr:hypothetical protein ONZ45_g108 [Pleurotus djamor]
MASPLVDTKTLRCDPSAIHFSLNGTPTFSDEHSLKTLEIAAQQISQLAQPVVIPTETVYGLAADASNSAAVSRIFSTKGRPADNPLIVHVSSLTMLNSLLPEDYTIPPAYKILMDKFWPGALTLLFPRNAARVPSIVTAGQSTVAIRMPSHPVARALIHLADKPLAAPSANSSGKPSPTRAEHVERDLAGKVGVIIDGGSCDIGLESTVVDGLHPDGDIRVLRPGGVTVEEMERALEKGREYLLRVPRVLVHKRDYTDEHIEQVPTTPGMKYRHYSPSVPVVLLLTQSNPPPGQSQIPARQYFATLAEEHAAANTPKIGLLIPDDSPLSDVPRSPRVDWHIFSIGLHTDPATIARRLFDGLLTLERKGVGLIIIEEIDQAREGLAVMNRIRKAASEVVWVSSSDC